MFKPFISKHNLLSVNVQSLCKGPVHIHKNLYGGPCSAIDHILVSHGLITFIINATVDNDCSHSLSDNTQVICSMSAIRLLPLSPSKPDTHHGKRPGA